MKLRNKMALCMAVVFILFTVALGVAVYGMRDTNARFKKFIENDQAFLVETNTLYAQGLQMGQALRNIILAPNNSQGYENLAAARDAFRESLKHAQALASDDALIAQRLSKIQATQQQQVVIQDRIVALAKQDQATAIVILNAEETPLWRSIRVELIDMKKKMNAGVEVTKTQLADSTSSRLTLSLVLAGWAIALGAAVSFWLTRNIMRQLGGEPDYAVAIAAGIAAGDLTAHIVVDHEKNTGSMVYAMRTMQRSLAQLVDKVRTGTDTITMASSEMAAGNLDLSARTEEQTSSLQQTAASMEELTSTIQQNAESVRRANELAAGASEVAKKGGQAVNQVVETMGAIDEASSRIAEITSVIDGIAFQTNILALNAAVEAARAGEQGRGFAVVASEVRTLAQRSAAAAKEIKVLIAGSVERIAVGGKLANQAGETMSEVVTSVRRLTDLMSEINLAGQEQSSGIAQINQAVAQMDHVTQQNAALVEEAAVAADAMQAQAQHLLATVNTFKVAKQVYPIEKIALRSF